MLDFYRYSWNEIDRNFRAVIKDGDKIKYLSCGSFWKWYGSPVEWQEINDLPIGSEERNRRWTEKEAKINIQIAQGNGFFSNQIGFVINKDIPQKMDIAWSSVASFCTSICRPQIKQAIEEANLIGILFYPVWLKKYEENKEPDYYLMVSPNRPDFEKYVINKDSDIGIQYIYKKEMKDILLDFNQAPSKNYILIEPSLISEKAYNILKDFNITFKPAIFQ